MGDAVVKVARGAVAYLVLGGVALLAYVSPSFQNAWSSYGLSESWPLPKSVMLIAILTGVGWLSSQFAHFDFWGKTREMTKRFRWTFEHVDSLERAEPDFDSQETTGIRRLSIYIIPSINKSKSRFQVARDRRNAVSAWRATLDEHYYGSEDFSEFRSYCERWSRTARSHLSAFFAILIGIGWSLLALAPDIVAGQPLNLPLPYYFSPKMGELSVSLEGLIVALIFWIICLSVLLKSNLRLLRNAAQFDLAMIITKKVANFSETLSKYMTAFDLK